MSRLENATDGGKVSRLPQLRSADLAFSESLAGVLDLLRSQPRADVRVPVRESEGWWWWGGGRGVRRRSTVSMMSSHRRIVDGSGGSRKLFIVYGPSRVAASTGDPSPPAPPPPAYLPPLPSVLSSATASERRTSMTHLWGKLGGILVAVDMVLLDTGSRVAAILCI